MLSENSQPSTPNANPHTSREVSGEDRPANQRSGHSRTSRGERPGGGRNRGRESRRNGFKPHAPNGHQPLDSTDTPGHRATLAQGLDQKGIPGRHPAGDVGTLEGDVPGKSQEDAEADSDGEVCFICASPVEHHSVAPCNHRTCHICALRLRALYKNRMCAHCRTEADYVIFTDDASRRYEEFGENDFEKTDGILGIRYERSDIHQDTVLLLRYNCPESACDIACWGWPDLHRHVRSVHHRVLCDLCTRNKKVFTHEHELFTHQELRRHEKFGDDNPGAVDQSGFKGHPECGFCRIRFYGDDELYEHCRDKHEKCFICDRRNTSRHQQYYVDYRALENHFRQDHFLCSEQECLDNKTGAFESEMDLKAHQLEVHPNGFSKDARKDARRVDISAFDYRTPHSSSRGGRGRDPNTEAVPPPTPQPLRRDELAYQRQMAIQSAQSTTTRTVGAQLTSQTSSAARSNGISPNPTTVTASQTHLPAMQNLQLNPSSDSAHRRSISPASLQALTPQEQARRLQHASVMDRASLLLKNNASKISSFRSAVSSYWKSNLTASQLIDTFFSLFDVPAPELGKLIKELADIYDDEDKRNELLKSWNDWRAINEDYPSLPGPSGELPGSSAGAAGSGGKRVLKLKSSTAQSSRSAVSRQGSWGNAVNGQPFPPISASLSTSRSTPHRIGAPPWLAPSSSSSSISQPTSRASTLSQPSASSHSSSSDAFPALPAAAKPNTFLSAPTRGSVRWNDLRGSSSGSNSSPWGTAPMSPKPSGNTTDDVKGNDDGGPGAKKKTSKGKKQTLYRFG